MQFGEQTEIFMDAVCYGIGRISEFKHVEYQLALLVLVLRRNALGCFKSQQFEFYDPIMNAVEIKAMEYFGGRKIAKNEQGKRRIVQPTLFYMPHCVKELYNNVLWANWPLENIRNVFIIGNSLNEYLEKSKCNGKNNSSTYKPSADHVIRAVSDSKALIEIQFLNQFPISGAFNDMSMHMIHAQSELFESPPDEYIADESSELITPEL
jgi:hypothetical protein